MPMLSLPGYSLQFGNQCPEAPGLSPGALFSEMIRRVPGRAKLFCHPTPDTSLPDRYSRLQLFRLTREKSLPNFGPLVSRVRKNTRSTATTMEPDMTYSPVM